MPAFTPKAVERIRKSVKFTEGMPRDLTGSRRPGQPAEASFWAIITGLKDLFFDGRPMDKMHTWVRAVPDPESGEYVADPSITGDCAFEVGGQVVEADSVVRLFLVGRDELTDHPMYAFIRPPPKDQWAMMPIHDHRDNLNGGFAFAVFHPGTALGQMRWSI